MRRCLTVVDDDGKGAMGDNDGDGATGDYDDGDGAMGDSATGYNDVSRIVTEVGENRRRGQGGGCSRLRGRKEGWEGSLRRRVRCPAPAVRRRGGRTKRDECSVCKWMFAGSVHN